MKTKTKLRILTLLAGISLLSFTVLNCSSPDSSPAEESSLETLVEGVFQYMSPINGIALVYDNYYSYTYATSDSTMEAITGTYEISNDTATNTVLYSNNEKMVGYKFKWKLDSINGDTVSFVTFNMNGEETERFKALKIK